MRNTKIREGVIVDRDSSTEPSVRVVLLGEAGESTGAADAVDGGEEPEGEEQARVGGA